MKNGKPVSAAVTQQTRSGLLLMGGTAILLLIALFALQVRAQDSATLAVPVAAVPAPVADAAPAAELPAVVTTTTTTTTDAAIPAATLPASVPVVAAGPSPVPPAIATPTGLPVMPVPTVVGATANAAMPAAAGATTTTATAPLPAGAMPIMAPVPRMASATIPVPAMPVDLPPGTPTAVGDVMRDLQKAQQGISVDDMVRAEDALARLDLMLAIQKKLKEYKDAQADAHGDENSSPFGMPSGPASMPTAIPASALNLPIPSATPVSIVTPVVKAKPVAPKAVKYDVQQISGSNNNISAVLVMPDGDHKTVRIGDELDGQQVTNISADGVQLRSDKGTVKTISVKNDGFALAPFAR